MEPLDDPHYIRMVDAHERLTTALAWVHPQWTRNLITRNLKLLEAKIATYRMPGAHHG